jgi:uncharacterized protein
MSIRTQVNGETRMTNAESNPNVECRSTNRTMNRAFTIRHSDFVIDSAFAIRVLALAHLCHGCSDASRAGENEVTPPNPYRPQSVLRVIAGALGRLVAFFLLSLVHLYRHSLGYLLGGHCRYQPTCSQYMLDALHKYGPWRGAWLGIKRIARCHPWGGSGDDPA